MTGRRATHCSSSASQYLRWPDIGGIAAASATARVLLPYAFGLLLYEHYCFPEGGVRLPFLFAADHGLNQGPAREVVAADYLCSCTCDKSLDNHSNQ